MATNIEVSRAEEIGPLVKKHGVALWRGLVPETVTQEFIDPVFKNVGDKSRYISRHYGVLTMEILPPDLKLKAFSAIGEVTAKVLSACTVYSGEIYITAPGFIPHEWHQDANRPIDENHLFSWTAITPCGVEQPGLTFALGNPGQFLGGKPQAAERAQDLEHVTPHFMPGDTVFFDLFSLHKTHTTEAMKYNRIAYKVCARQIPVGQAVQD